MKLSVIALLGVTSVAGVAKPDISKASAGSYCGTVFKRDPVTGSVLTTTETKACKNYTVCASLDLSGINLKPTLNKHESSSWSSFMAGWGMGVPSMCLPFKDPDAPNTPDAATQTTCKTNLDNGWKTKGTAKQQFRCVHAVECNKTWNGVKVTCADVAAGCDKDCMKEKYKEFADLGSGFDHWLTCNIYAAGQGCKHESKDKKYCCATPVTEDGATPQRVSPMKPNYMGDGLCIPVDHDKTDGKVTTTTFQYAQDRATASSWQFSQDHMDKNPQTVPNPQPLLTIPSQSIKLECGATELAAATTAAAIAAAVSLF